MSELNEVIAQQQNALLRNVALHQQELSNTIRRTFDDIQTAARKHNPPEPTPLNPLRAMMRGVWVENQAPGNCRRVFPLGKGWLWTRDGNEYRKDSRGANEINIDRLRQRIRKLRDEWLGVELVMLDWEDNEREAAIKRGEQWAIDDWLHVLDVIREDLPGALVGNYWPFTTDPTPAPAGDSSWDSIFEPWQKILDHQDVWLPSLYLRRPDSLFDSVSGASGVNLNNEYIVQNIKEHRDRAGDKPMGMVFHHRYHDLGGRSPYGLQLLKFNTYDRICWLAMENGADFIVQWGRDWNRWPKGELPELVRVDDDTWAPPQRALNGDETVGEYLQGLHVAYWDIAHRAVKRAGVVA